MLNLSLGAPVSLLVAGTALGFGLLLPKPADALTFNFSYTFGPGLRGEPAGSLLSGTLEGDLQPDGNTVTNIRNLSAFFQFPSGSPVFFDELFPSTADDSLITLNGSAVSLIGWNSTLGINQFNEFLAFNLRSPGNATVFYVETFVDEPFDPARWRVSQVDDNSVGVPEPGSVIALALFSAGCLMTGMCARTRKSAKLS